MDKFIQTFTGIGQTINHVTEQCTKENDAINTVDTLDTFVKLNKTKRDMPTEYKFETYQTSQDLIRYRAELA